MGYIDQNVATNHASRLTGVLEFPSNDAVPLV
jgi:hypothetical protein